MDQSRAIQVVQVGREMRIPRTEIERMVGNSNGRLLILYARVSRRRQQEDLALQVQHLQTWAATERRSVETLVLCEIGSGLKTSRRQLQRLLKLVGEDKVGEVAITSADRLTRCGQEYLTMLFACFGVTLTIVGPDEEQSMKQELAEDLLTLMASLAGQIYGMQSPRRRELLQCMQTVLSRS
ncbi:MAG TPA: IS607 family transposase [Ktedonobacteraceae bacterium]